MVFSLVTVRHSASLVAWWLPVLGVLLTVCGVGLLAVSVGELVAPVRVAGSVAHSTAIETMASRADPLAPAAGEAWSGPGDVALAAPADRQPRPTLEAPLKDGTPDGRRGWARDYLDETAAARWLAPLYRPLLAWDETSGYGAVERSRADRLAPVLAMNLALGCTAGAEYLETPSCSAVPAPLD